MNRLSTRHARTVLCTAVRPRLPRPVILIAAVLMLLAISTAARSNPAEASTSQKPTIVLVHGAWAGPSSWDQVAAGLHKDGYATVTPTLGLASLEDDAATVRAALDSIPGKKILVGHSYGGVIISYRARRSWSDTRTEVLSSRTPHTDAPTCWGSCTPRRSSPMRATRF
jgi:pimeloyl-ACP methyl ester carboxylesterase